MSEVTCRGSFALGTACGKCSRCRTEKLGTEIADLKAKLAKSVEERDALTEALVEAMIVPEAWMMSGFPEMSNEAREQVIASVTKARTTLAELEAKLVECEARLSKAVGVLDEAIYLLDPDEEDIAKKTGLHRIVTAYEELTGGKDE